MAKVFFYYSTMNAGKTTTLLQSAYNYHERGMRTLILLPATDVRLGDGIVGSRIGIRAQGRSVGSHVNLFEVATRDVAEHGPLHCVLVDEAQFLTKQQIWQLTDIADRLNIPVLAYGL